MDIPRASLAMVQAGKDGRRISITEDVCDIAKRLGEIDPRLVLRYNEAGEFFEVVECLENGSESRVTTATELTPALVEHVRWLGSEDYKLADQIAKAEAKREAEVDRRFEEQIGERGEVLAHAIRKDIEAQNKAFVPREV